ncbi:MAG: acyltransferase family protein [Alphaproteobacteria bacterium]|nr:acyltransferase family protein [Alphaproteobacteria bacterium]
MPVVYIALWVLWPIATLAGGLALAPLTGLAAILLIPFCVARLRLPLYLWPLLAFLGFAAASSSWSPQPMVWADINFSEGRFNIKSEALRVGLLVPAMAVLWVALSSATSGTKRIIRRTALLALVAQAVIVALLSAFETDALALFAPLMANSGEGVQNISRNSLIMAMAAPSLILFATLNRSGGWTLFIAVLVIALEALGLLHRGVHAGLLALVGAGLAIGLVTILPRYGFRIMGCGVAALTLLAPILFGWIARGADASLATSSMEWRLAIWRRVTDLISEAPIIGNGLGVLRTIEDRIPEGTFAGELLVPNHSHNMFLQLWVETGAVGAVCLALFLILVAWRLPDFSRLGRSGLAIAGLFGGVTAIACVSFDLWNAWWWAAVVIVGLLALVFPNPGEMETTRQASEPRTITFGGGSAITMSSVKGAPDTDESRPSGSWTISEEGAPSPLSIDRDETTRNNFNLLRLVFASMVAIYHCVKLSGVDAWTPLTAPLSVAAEIGVQGFFVLSGYLVMGSLERSSSIASYAEKRVRRVVPAYAVTVLACALGALWWVGDARADLSAVARYIVWNLSFLNFMEPNLPGVFVGNPQTEINGALWTLKIEVLFYLILPILAWILRVAGGMRWLLLVAIYVSAELWRAALEQVSASTGQAVWIELSRQLPGQMSFFIVGVAFYLWREALTWRSLLPALGVGLFLLSVTVPAAEPLRALGLGVTSLWCALAWPQLFDAARWGDLSYGVYIIHFPILQVIVALGLFASSPALASGVSAAAILLGSVLMWWTVERPSLRADSAYRKGV